MLQPIHIATRGRLAGEYAIATRGLLVCPDIVPHFPVDGVLGTRGLVGAVRELELGATLRSLELEGQMAARPDLVAVLRSLDILGEVSEVDELEELEAREFLVGLVRELGLHGEIRSLDTLGEVSDQGIEGILRALELLGDTSDEPPHC